METAKLHSSVAIFRLRCLRVMTIWAREWLSTYHGKKPMDSIRWVLAVQLAYWSVLRRNPTIAEWVADVLYISTFDPPKEVIRNLVAARKLPVEPKLVIHKHYTFRLYQHGRDMDAALQAWSRDVGRTFWDVQFGRSHDALPADRDWVDPDVIKAFIAETKLHAKSGFSLTAWLRSIILGMRLMLTREHLRSQP